MARSRSWRTLLRGSRPGSQVERDPPLEARDAEIARKDSFILVEQDRIVRPCAVSRKVWGGNPTWAGADTYGISLNVLATAAKHRVDGIDYPAARARGPDPGLAALLGGPPNHPADITTHRRRSRLHPSLPAITRQPHPLRPAQKPGNQ